MKKMRFIYYGLSFVFTCLLSTIFSTPVSNAQDCEYYNLEVCKKIEYSTDCYRCDYGSGDCDVSGQDPDCIY